MKTIEDPKFEILPPDVATASTELSCSAEKVAALYKPFEKPFQAAAELLAEEEKAATAFDARALRLKMVKARTTITATKDKSKSDIKLAGYIIDWFHNKCRDRLAAAESRLLEIEKAEREQIEAAAIETKKREKAEAEAKALRDAEAKRIADEKAAAAPDKAKLMILFATLGELKIPIMESPEGKAIAADAMKQISSVMRMIETHASNL